MTQDIDSSPVIFDIYYYSRQLFTPNNQNLKYLFIESIICSLIISVIYYTIYDNVILPSVVFISFILIPLTNYIFIQKDEIHLEEKVLSITKNKFLYILIISLIPLLILYIIKNVYSIFVILFIVIYCYSLYWRSKKYLSEPKFYVNIHSDISTEWYKASIYLENGIKQLQNEKLIRSFYWFKKSQKKYEFILENEERISLKEGAEALSQAALFYSELTFVDRLKHELYYRKADKRVKQANQFFSTRFCDECGKRKHIDNVSLFNNNKIYCKFCQMNNKKSRKTQNNVKDTMTKKEAKQILNISGSLTESNIKNAFRKKVKKVHPDLGGSEKEFKEVKKARDILLNN